MFTVYKLNQIKIKKFYLKLVHFNSKLFTGIKHEDILSELEKEINLEDIKSIQMTEKSCIVMLKSGIGAQFNI
jgi:hypothetical protein